MMSPTERDPLVDLERHRLRLEDNVATLRKALKEWRTWDLEYETLKEEIERHQGHPDAAEMIKIGRTLGGKLVNEREVEELLGRDRLTKRTSLQVVEMISRRVDYVQRNIQTVSEQLSTAERKLNNATILLEPDLDDEDGLPVTDIQEELDEEDNIISSSLTHPTNIASELLDHLHTAGISISESSAEPVGRKDSTSKDETSTNQSNSGVSKVRCDSDPALKTPATVSKKSVTFSQDTTRGPSTSKAPGLSSTGCNEELAAFTFNKGEKVIEVDENDDEVVTYPVIPSHESPEDATLRRQMLQYGLSEVGSVVAEIDLDQQESECSDDYDIESDDASQDDDYEEEDNFGRATRRVISDEYKNQMIELEKKWDARLLKNVGPSPASISIAAENADDLPGWGVRKTGNGHFSTRHSERTSAKKKGVRFADSLDISPDLKTNRRSNDADKLIPPNEAAMADMIVERESLINASPTKYSKPARVSQFNSSRAGTFPQPSTAPPVSCSSAGPNAMPEGPPGQTLAPTVVERTVHDNHATAPQPDEFDPALLSHGVAVEYHRLRNRMIQKQGGFLASKEEAEDPLMEERDGKVKKVSRFKAARLKADGM